MNTPAPAAAPFTFADAVCGVSIRQKLSGGYAWTYSQEDAYGLPDGYYGDTRSVSGALAAGVPLAIHEATTMRQGGRLLHLTLTMTDGRMATLFCPAAGPATPLDKVADMLVSKLKTH